MDTLTHGPQVLDPQSEAKSFVSCFGNPAKSYKDAYKTKFSSLSEFVAALHAKRAALKASGAIVVDIPNVKLDSYNYNVWIVLDDGRLVPTNWCYHTTSKVWFANLDDPDQPLELLRDECGKSWRFTIGPSAQEARARVNALDSVHLTRCVSMGLCPNDLIRRSRVHPTNK